MKRSWKDWGKENPRQRNSSCKDSQARSRHTLATRVFPYHLWLFLDYAGRRATVTYGLWSVKDYLTLYR